MAHQDHEAHRRRHREPVEDRLREDRLRVPAPGEVLSADTGGGRRVGLSQQCGPEDIPYIAPAGRRRLEAVDRCEVREQPDDVRPQLETADDAMQRFDGALRSCCCGTRDRPVDKTSQFDQYGLRRELAECRGDRAAVEPRDDLLRHPRKRPAGLRPCGLLEHALDEAHERIPASAIEVESEDPRALPHGVLLRGEGPGHRDQELVRPRPRRVHSISYKTIDHDEHSRLARILGDGVHGGLQQGDERLAPLRRSAPRVQAAESAPANLTRGIQKPPRVADGRLHVLTGQSGDHARHRRRHGDRGQPAVPVPRVGLRGSEHPVIDHTDQVTVARYSARLTCDKLVFNGLADQLLRPARQKARVAGLRHRQRPSRSHVPVVL